MRLLTFYVARSITQMGGLVLLVLAGLESFIQCLHELHDLSPLYPFKAMLVTVLLKLPLALYQFLPMIGMLAVLGSLNHLASTGELMMMQASGLSIKKLMLIVIGTVIFWLSVMTAVGETIGPSWAHNAMQKKLLSISSGSLLATQSGFWVEAQDYILHIGTVMSPDDIRSITHYRMDKHHQVQQTGYAQSARLDHGRWFFYNGCHTDFKQKNCCKGLTHSTCYSKKSMPFYLSASWLKSAKLAPEFLSLSGLYFVLRDTKSHTQVDQEKYYIFWKRVFRPFFVCIIVGLLAFSMMKGTQLRHSSLYVGLLGMLGVILYVLSELVGPVCVFYDVPPILAAVVLPLGTFLIGWLLVAYLSIHFKTL